MYRDFDLENLEREYSPSSCVEDIEVFIQAYCQMSQQTLKHAKQNEKVLTDLAYGHSASHVLDLFLPDDNTKPQKKLHVYIHGGYWQELSKNESCFAANNFQRHGYHFAVLDYTLAPHASLSEIVKECQQALAWLFQHADKYGYDQDEIYLSGSSAGGHLAMMMALTDWSKLFDCPSQIINGICAVSGIYDLTPIQQTYINKPLQLTQSDIDNNSPLLMEINTAHVKQCQITLAYGENETSEFKRQTQAMQQLLQSHAISTSCQEIAKRNHFDVILDLANSQSWLFQQVQQQMT